jgi:hypothetical protein
MNTSSLHEWVELAKGLAWPGLILYCVTRYSRELKVLLRGIGASLERVKSAKGFGVELELETLEGRAQPLTISPAQPPEPPQTIGGRQVSSMPQAAQLENRVLSDLESAPALALMRLSLEVDRQLRLLLAASGGLDRYSGTNPPAAVALLAQHVASMPTELATVVSYFWQLRNQVIHEGLNQSSLALSGVDYGLRIVRMLANIPRPKYVVTHANIPMFEDPSLSLPSPGGKGILLRSYDAAGKDAGTHFCPSTRTYAPDMSVSWEWKGAGAGWGPTWYPDPVTGEAKFAWDGSLEFIGRDLSTI